jgi:hypothetical protein
MNRYLINICKFLCLFICGYGNTYKINNILKNELIIKAKLCKICYSRTGRFNISRNKMLYIYDNYLLINETSTRSISYIFYNKNQIDICFKGTSNIRDNYFNFNICPKTFESPEIKIHNGFLSKYLSIRDKMMEHIKDIMARGDINKITCNGHSSGGAMATIAVIDIYDNILRVEGNEGRDMTIECVTFGSPRVGNSGFISKYNECVNNSVRIVNWNDIIQFVPPPIPYLYRHIHKPLLLNECRKINLWNEVKYISYMNIYRYLKKSHGITGYIKNIINCN